MNVLKVNWYNNLFLAILFSSLSGQVPNGGFENWTGTEPDSWITNNLDAQNLTVTKSNDNRSGSFAVKGEVINFFANPYPPTLISNTGGAIGFPVSQTYLQLTGYYQFSQPTSGNVLYVSLLMFNATVSDTTVVGAAATLLGGTGTVYQPFSTDIIYFPFSPAPNRCQITIMITDTIIGFPAIGANFLIDDLNLEGVSDISPENNTNPSGFSLEQNYPNPFNPVTTIRYSLENSNEVLLKIFDISGREVVTLVNDFQTKGYYTIQWDAGNQSSGIYYYRLKSGTATITRRMVLLK